MNDKRKTLYHVLLVTVTNYVFLYFTN